MLIKFHQHRLLCI